MPIQRCCAPAEIDSADRSADADLFKALGDPHRLTMLATLARAEEEVCVCDFTSALPLNQPTVSHHLKILRDAGLVTWERRGTWVYYRLAGDARDRLHAALGSLLPERALA
jgi:ArsR family transcriptional regulator